MNKYSLAIMMFSWLSCNAYSAVYSGFNLGVNTVSVHKDLMYPLEETEPTSSSFNSAYTGFHGQLFAGYDYSLKEKFSAQIEANADWFTGKSEFSVKRWYFEEGVYAKEQLKYGVSLFLLPTYQYNQSTRLFVGPGVSYSNFAVSTDYTAGNVGVSTRFNHWLTGGGLKAGIMTKLCNSLDLVFTYQFTQYNTIQRTHLEPLSEETLQGNYKPNVNAVFVGFRTAPDWGHWVK